MTSFSSKLVLNFYLLSKNQRLSWVIQQSLFEKNKVLRKLK